MSVGRNKEWIEVQYLYMVHPTQYRYMFNKYNGLNKEQL